MNLETLGPFVPWILGGTIFGFICRAIAKSKGFSPSLWFVLGFFAHIFTLIIIASLPSAIMETEIAELQEEVEDLKGRLSELENRVKQVLNYLKMQNQK